MKKILGALALSALAACQSVGDIIPAGQDTYMVSTTGMGAVKSFTELKALSIDRATSFCVNQKKDLEVIGSETSGARGWTPMEAEIRFKCIARN